MSDIQPRFEHIGKTDFPSNRKVFFCVWRKRPPENAKVYFHFSDTHSIALDDLIFCDSDNYSGYARIVDFVRSSDGTISDYILQNAEIDYKTSLLMAQQTHSAIEDFLSKSDDPSLCVIVCLKSKVQKDRK